MTKPTWVGIWLLGSTLGLNCTVSGSVFVFIPWQFALFQPDFLGGTPPKAQMLADSLETRNSVSIPPQGSLHYAPEHCLVFSWFPFYFGVEKKHVFQMVAKLISFKELCPSTGPYDHRESKIKQQFIPRGFPFGRLRPQTPPTKRTDEARASRRRPRRPVGHTAWDPQIRGHPPWT